MVNATRGLNLGQYDVLPGLEKKHTTQFSGIADKPFRDSFRHFETELSAKPKQKL